MHLALQTTLLEQFAWGDFAKHILRLDDNDNGIEDWGAWLKGLWEGTGLAEAVSGQIENEVVDTRCNSTEAKENGEIDSAAGTQTPVELTEQNAQTSGDNPHTSTIMTHFKGMMASFMAMTMILIVMKIVEVRHSTCFIKIMLCSVH